MTDFENWPEDVVNACYHRGYRRNHGGAPDEFDLDSLTAKEAFLEYCGWHGLAHKGEELWNFAHQMSGAVDTLAALKAFVEVTESEAFKSWDRAAVLTALRYGSEGYQGKPLPTEQAKAAIAKAEAWNA